MEPEVANDLGLIEINKIHLRKQLSNKKKPGPNKQSRVRICFSEAYERDIVMSFASSLEDGASIEAVIPEHLSPLQRHLESFAFRIRKNAKARNSKISTSVRLQDSNMSLMLALKGEGKKKWSYHTKEELQMNDEKNKKEDRQRSRNKAKQEDAEMNTDLEGTDDSDSDMEEEGEEEDEFFEREDESGVQPSREEEAAYNLAGDMEDM